MPSTSDERIVNNVVRHEYRKLTDDEKTQMQDIKDMGLEFITYLFSLPVQKSVLDLENGLHKELDQAKVFAYTQAKINMEQAVMWAVKGVTG